MIDAKNAAHANVHPVINMLHQMTNFVDEMSGTMLR